MKFCPQCGKKLSEGAKFCDGCGFKIEEVKKDETKKEEEVEVLVEETKPEEKKKEVLTNTQGLEVIDVDSVVGNNGNYSDEIISVTPELSTTPKTEKVPTLESVETAPISNGVTAQTASVNNTAVTTNNMVSNQVSNVNTQKKTNPAILAIIGVLVLVIIVLVILIGVKVLGTKTDDNSSNNGNDSDVVETTTGDDNSSSSNTSNNNGSNTASSQTIELSGYTFNIPTGYTSKINEGYLELTNLTDKVQIIGQVLDSYSYSTFTTNVQSIKDELAASGYTVSSVSEEKIGSTNSLVVVCSSNGQIFTYVITALNDYDTLLAAYVNYGTKTDSELKLVLSNLATTATPKTSSFANKVPKNYQAGQIKVPSFTLEK